MSDAVELPAAAAAQPDAVESTVPVDVRVANTGTMANAVTAITGLSGAGKSALADTAAEYCAEQFGKITLCYAIDPGGFGTKRLALIRAGVMHVWDPRNHVNYFETMELISLGAWPEKIEDPERGYADPNVKLIMPRRIVADLYCPAGHVARRFETELEMNVASAAGGVPCGSCGVLTNLQNASKVEKLVVRHKMFRNVGLRIYDSFSAMNDAGLIIELPTMSANNKFAKTQSGGSALGSADAFRQGTVAYGTGSEAQVGFMQNRSYGWLMNIRTLPDVVVPTICTFGIEESKKDDESGGLQVLGMRIAGKARTSAAAGWVGHLLYASHEPEDIPRGTATSPNLVYRLWLTTHTDPRDARRLPILAKHRGTPLGIDYLEDPYEADPIKRRENAWSRCSLGVFFKMLDAQVAEETAKLQAKFAKVEGLHETYDGPDDEVLGAAGGRAVVQTSPVMPGTPAPAAGASAAPAAAGMPRMARRRGGAPVATVMPPVAQAATPAAAAPVASSAVGSSGVTTPVTATPSQPPVEAAVEAPSVVQQQLEASIAKIEADKGAEAKTTTPAQSAPPTASAPAPSTVSTPAATGTSASAPAQPVAPAGNAGAAPSGSATAQTPATTQPTQPPVTHAAPQTPTTPTVPGAPRVVRRPKPPIQ